MGISGQNGTFKPTTNQLSEQDEQQFKALENAAGKKLSTGNQTAIEEMLKQYQTYAEKRKEIEENFRKILTKCELLMRKIRNPEGKLLSPKKYRSG